MLGFNEVLIQKQTVSQQMIQSMEILQMSAQELDQHIRDLAEENIVLELEDTDEHLLQHPQDKRELDRRRQLEWLVSADHQNHIYHENEDGDPEFKFGGASDEDESLSSYLLAQIIHRQYAAQDRKILDYIIYSLDARGYFTEDPAETAGIFSVPEEKILLLLKEIQALDPAGVGARGLKECLLLQLRRKQPHSGEAETIILLYLEELAKNHISAIAKAMKVSPEDVQRAAAEIRTLNPKPGNGFGSREYMKYIRPDAVVVRVQNGFEILISEYQYRKFHINSFYQELSETTDDEETRKYLREKIGEVKKLENDIASRKSVLSRIMHILVDRQYRFFCMGPGNMAPLSLSDISEASGLHTSTVSRTLRGKYLQCSFGVYPLSYFLARTAAVAENGQDKLAQETVRRKIRDIIDAENKTKPLSDEAIRRKLAEEGIALSRRTVNKYRQAMGIPDKGGRKSL